MVKAPNFRSHDPRFESCWRQNSAHDYMALYCTEPFIIIITSTRYDLNNVERNEKHQPSLSSSTLFAEAFQSEYLGYICKNFCLKTLSPPPPHQLLKGSVFVFMLCTDIRETYCTLGNLCKIYFYYIHKNPDMLLLCLFHY